MLVPAVSGPAGPEPPSDAHDASSGHPAVPEAVWTMHRTTASAQEDSLQRTTQVIQRESGLKPDFLEEIYEIPGGEHVKECIQCGTCSGSCPAAQDMEHTPREIIGMIRAGTRDQVLSSNTMWMCASCYMCQSRCPAQIKVTDVMYALKRVALAEGKAQPKASYMAQVFVDNINTYGRNDERMLIFNYYLKTNPGKFLSYAPIGLSMVGKGLLSMGAPERIRNIDQIRKIVCFVGKEGTA